MNPMPVLTGTAFTPGPRSRTISANLRYRSTTSFGRPRKWSPIVIRTQECHMLGETNRCPHLGQALTSRHPGAARIGGLVDADLALGRDPVSVGDQGYDERAVGAVRVLDERKAEVRR